MDYHFIGCSSDAYSLIHNSGIYVYDTGLGFTCEHAHCNGIIGVCVCVIVLVCGLLKGIELFNWHSVFNDI